MNPSAFLYPAFLGGSPGGGELLLILVVALLLFGSRRLPEIARSIGRAIEEFRRSAREIQDEVMRAADAPPVEQRHDNESLGEDQSRAG